MLEMLLSLSPGHNIWPTWVSLFVPVIVQTVGARTLEVEITTQSEIIARDCEV